MGDFDAIGALDDVALSDPVLIAAFAGDDDAAEAASESVRALVDRWEARLVAELDLGPHLDYALLQRWRQDDSTDSTADLRWPTLQVWLAAPPGVNRDVLLIQGMAPHTEWHVVTQWLADLFDHADAQLLVLLAAHAADVPYDAPLPVTASTSQLDLDPSVGDSSPPSRHQRGFVAAVADAFGEAHLPSIAFWVAVPDYLETPVCPKASVPLVGAVEDVLGATIRVPDLAEAARAWQRGVEALAAEQTPVGRAIRSKAVKDEAWRDPHASGEVIAADFERYLRRRDET